MRALALALLLGSAACGFQLRGTASLPFETIYVPNATAGIALELKRSIQAGTNARVVDDARAAAAQLLFLEESRRKDILSLTVAGRVSEYRLLLPRPLSRAATARAATSCRPCPSSCSAT